jgi:hypothetical protein
MHPILSTRMPRTAKNRQDKNMRDATKTDLSRAAAKSMRDLRHTLVGEHHVIWLDEPAEGYRTTYVQRQLYCLTTVPTEVAIYVSWFREGGKIVVGGRRRSVESVAVFAKDSLYHNPM